MRGCRDEGDRAVSQLPKERRVWPGELPWPCSSQTAAAAGTPVLFWGAPSLCHCPLSSTEEDPLPDCGSSAWASLWGRRERNQLRGLPFFQGDHHPAPRSCQAHQAHRGPRGLRAPSAARAWRFSSTSPSTCRVSAGSGGPCVCTSVLGVGVCTARPRSSSPGAGPAGP